MTTGEKIGIAVTLLIVGGGLYWHFTKKGADVAEAAKDEGGGGGGGGGSSPDAAVVRPFNPVMMAGVSPAVITIHPPIKSSPAPIIGRPSSGIAPKPSLKPTPTPVPVKKPVVKGLIKVGADGYQWKSDY